MPRYSLDCLRTCRRIYSELVDEFYKDQTLVINVYDIIYSAYALIATSPRDRRLAFNMRTETRSYFKKLEIRLLDMKDPNAYRKGPYWESMNEEAFSSDRQFKDITGAFPNLESATISFELDEMNIRYWGGSYSTFARMAEGLFAQMPGHIELRWDFRPTIRPDLQELAKEMDGIMSSTKKVVSEETAKRGGTVQLGESIIKDYPRFCGR
jgi:hypothetical protein